MIYGSLTVSKWGRDIGIGYRAKFSVRTSHDEHGYLASLAKLGEASEPLTPKCKGSEVSKIARLAKPQFGDDPTRANFLVELRFKYELGEPVY